MLKTCLLTVVIVVLLFNVLNIDYGNLLDFNKNKSHFVNLFICVLVILYLLIYKDEK